MKKITILLFYLFFAVASYAQQSSPAHFSYAAKKVSDKTYELTIKATMDEGWHIYAQSQPKDAVAEPTKFVFAKNPLLIITGKPKEIGKKEKYENKEVGIVQYHYADSVLFVQIVKLKANVKTNISGTITYQTCTDERCLPAKTIPFNIKIE